MDEDRLKATRAALYLVEAHGERGAKRLERLSLEGSGLRVDEIHLILRDAVPEDFSVVVGYDGSTQAAVNALIDCGYDLGDIGVDREL